MSIKIFTVCLIGIAILSYMVHAYNFQYDKITPIQYCVYNAITHFTYNVITHFTYNVKYSTEVYWALLVSIATFSFYLFTYWLFDESSF